MAKASNLSLSVAPGKIGNDAMTRTQQDAAHADISTGLPYLKPYSGMSDKSEDMHALAQAAAKRPARNGDAFIFAGDDSFMVSPDHFVVPVLTWSATCWHKGSPSLPDFDPVLVADSRNDVPKDDQPWIKADRDRNEKISVLGRAVMIYAIPESKPNKGDGRALWVSARMTNGLKELTQGLQRVMSKTTDPTWVENTGMTLPTGAEILYCLGIPMPRATDYGDNKWTTIDVKPFAPTKAHESLIDMIAVARWGDDYAEVRDNALEWFKSEVADLERFRYQGEAATVSSGEGAGDE